jgi:hypothetical protein
MLTVQYGYAQAALLDSLLQFCPAESAVLETSASNHTNASSSKIQSTAACPAANLVTSPALLAGGVCSACFLGGAAAASAEGACGGAGAAAAASAGGLDGVGVGVVRGHWHGTMGGLGTEAV